MSERHTKGPWRRVDTPDYAEIHAEATKGKQAIALVGDPNDANLIAAAPDLLAIATDLCAWEERYPTNRIYSENATRLMAEELSEIAERARAAIAKAEGKETGDV